MTMIERVARAMWFADGLKHADNSTIEQSWNDSHRYHKDYRRRARAAIEAMREPTEAMVAEGRVVLLDGERKTVEAYTAMIDAALEETK